MIKNKHQRWNKRKNFKKINKNLIYQIELEQPLFLKENKKSFILWILNQDKW
jgi:hypothetical protein